MGCGVLGVVISVAFPGVIASLASLAERLGEHIGLAGGEEWRRRWTGNCLGAHGGRRLACWVLHQQPVNHTQSYEVSPAQAVKLGRSAIRKKRQPPHCGQ